MHVEYRECHLYWNHYSYGGLDGEYAGHILISDMIKPHAKEAIRDTEARRSARRLSC